MQHYHIFIDLNDNTQVILGSLTLVRKVSGYTSNIGCKLKGLVHYHLVLTTEGLQMIASTLLYDKMLFNYIILVSYELRTKNGLYKKLAGCPTQNCPS